MIQMNIAFRYPQYAYLDTHEDGQISGPRSVPRRIFLFCAVNFFVNPDSSTMTRLQKALSALFSIMLSLATQSAFAQQTETGIHLADPTIFLHEGTYYLYGTVEGNANQGFLVYASKDMKSWEGPIGAKNGFALHKDDVFGDKGFWAPQVFHYRQKFYMAYTANENIAIAESDSPLGPFTQKNKVPLEAPVKQIDPFVYRAEDGKVYLYHVRLQEGNRIFVAEMEDDLSRIKEETLTECIHASDHWENTAQADWPVAEGPTVLKKKDLYYLIYSANDFRNPDYAVGYAVSKHPLGPWEKHPGNPILHQKDLNHPGTGHGDLLVGQNGDMWYVFHTHFSDQAVAPRRTALIKAGFTATGDDRPSLYIDKESFVFLKHP